MTTILSRKEWKAAPFKRAPRPHRVTVDAGQPVKEVVIHHTAGNDRPFVINLRNTQQQHLRHPKIDYSDIAYNGAVSNVEPFAANLRGPDAQGGATGAPVDAVTLSVVVLGNFSVEGTHKPTKLLGDNLEALLLMWIAMGKVAPDFVLSGHNKHRATLCPGQRITAELPDLQRRIRLAARPAPPVGEWEGRARAAEAKLEQIRRIL